MRWLILLSLAAILEGGITLLDSLSGEAMETLVEDALLDGAAPEAIEDAVQSLAEQSVGTITSLPGLTLHLREHFQFRSDWTDGRHDQVVHGWWKNIEMITAGRRDAGDMTPDHRPSMGLALHRPAADWWLGELRNSLGVGLLLSPGTAMGAIDADGMLAYPRQSCRLWSSPSTSPHLQGIAAQVKGGRGHFTLAAGQVSGNGGQNTFILQGGFAYPFNSCQFASHMLWSQQLAQRGLENVLYFSKRINGYLHRGRLALAITAADAWRFQVAYGLRTKTWSWRGGTYFYSNHDPADLSHGGGMWSGAAANEAGYRLQFDGRLPHDLLLKFRLSQGLRLKPEALHDNHRWRAETSLAGKPDWGRWRVRLRLRSHSEMEVHDWYQRAHYASLQSLDLRIEPTTGKRLTSQLDARFSWLQGTSGIAAGWRNGFELNEACHLEWGGFRYAIPTYDLRAIFYEPGVRHAFSLALLQGKGWRQYGVIRYQIVPEVSLEGKVVDQYDFTRGEHRYFLVMQMVVVN